MAKDSRIFQDIEATAGFYGPATYSGLEENDLGGLLTHFHDLDLHPDPEGEWYAPMTSVKVDPRNGKLFAVGVIPPSAEVTGLILDRSATVARKGGPGDITIPDETNQGVSHSSVADGTQTREEVLQDTQFWIEFVLMCQRLGVEPEELARVIQSESQFIPGQDNKRGAKGLQQWLKYSAKNLGGMTGEQWEALGTPEGLTALQQIPYLERSFRRMKVAGKKAPAIYAANFGGFKLPTGHFGYMSAGRFNQLNFEQQEKLIATLKKAGYTPERMFKFYYQNREADIIPPGDNNGIADSGDLGRRVSGGLKADVLAAIEQAKGAVESGAQSQIRGDGGDPKKKWAKDGSKDAKVVHKEQAKTSGVPLNQTDLGKNLQAAQRQAIKEAQAAIEGMKKVPPLRLLVNPRQFSVKGSKIVQDGNWSRRGPIIEHWGDEQDSISASGKVAAFYTNRTGLTRAARQFSAAWRNLQSLYLLYKNNGGIYLKDPFDPSRQTSRLTYVGSIYIYYDGILYVGSFSNFSITEEESTPYTVEYSFEFQVRAAFLLDQPDDKYSIQYSYENMTKDQPKPPLPTKSTLREDSSEGMVVGHHKSTFAEQREFKEFIARDDTAEIAEWEAERAKEEAEAKDDATKFLEAQAEKAENVDADVQGVLRR